jgi:hypothetical protein
VSSKCLIDVLEFANENVRATKINFDRQRRAVAYLPESEAYQVIGLQ